MVPQDQDEIPRAAGRALERLLDRLARDRESLLRGGCREAEAGLEHLNALARRADELKKALQSGRPGT